MRALTQGYTKLRDALATNEKLRKENELLLETIQEIRLICKEARTLIEKERSKKCRGSLPELEALHYGTAVYFIYRLVKKGLA